MSKTSAKSKYEQLLEWLGTINQPRKIKRVKVEQTFSKTDHYNKHTQNGKKGN